MSENRIIRVPSKWVLAGEHSVLRGCPAVIFPNPEFQVEMSESSPGFWMDPTQVRVEPEQEQSTLHKLLDRLRNLAVELELPVPRFPRKLTTHSTIPMGAGLGSSAALSVAVVKMILGEELGADRLRTLARRLEDEFHGESSGMDVAAVVAQGPVLFRKGETPEPIRLARPFRFSLHDTGLRASTRDCIERVKSHSNLAALDARMAKASDLAHRGLASGDARLIAESMTESLEVYREWGLVPEAVESQIQGLLASGANAVRMTGAGAGGFLVGFRD